MTNHKVSLLSIKWSQTWWPICTTCFYLALEPLVIKESFSQNALCVSNDGCTSQFKGARNWFHVSRYLKLLSFPKFPYGFMMYWNYWGINLEKVRMMVKALSQASHQEITTQTSWWKFAKRSWCGIVHL